MTYHFKKSGNFLVYTILPIYEAQRITDFLQKYFVNVSELRICFYYRYGEIWITDDYNPNVIEHLFINYGRETGNIDTQK